MCKTKVLDFNKIEFYFQIKAKSQDYPEGGKLSSIVINNTDGCTLYL